MPSGNLLSHLERGLADPSAAQELLDMLFGTTGNVFYVDSNTGSDTTNDGKDSGHPFATLDTAVAKCTANKGDVIYLMPGHSETLGATPIDIDVAGVSVIGLGRGSARPTFIFGNAASSIDIGASGCSLSNVVLQPSVTVVSIGIDVEAAVTDTLIQDVEVVPGEAGDGTDEFVIGIDVKAGCTRTVIRGLKYRLHASVDGAASCIKFTGASDSCEIHDCDLHVTGTAAVACINGDTTLSTRMVINNCRLTTDAEPGIELLTGTTGIIQDCLIFADLATIDAATVADGMAHYDVKYVEVGNEAGTLVKTESADD